MIRSVEPLRRFTIGATDGEIGSIKDVFFDDERWAVRYFVVDTAGWLLGREVLISPAAVESVDWSARRVDVRITRKQVEGSPEVNTHLPVSRRFESIYHDYYGYPYYWSGPYLWGAAAYPAAIAVKDAVVERAREEAARARETSDPHLRSCREVTGYNIEATDGSIGHIEDFLFDDESFAIRYVEVDTRNWWPSKHVLIAPQWITSVAWDARKVYLRVTRELVKSGPDYDPAMPLSDEYEVHLRRHYEQTAARQM